MQQGGRTPQTALQHAASATGQTAARDEPPSQAIDTSPRMLAQRRAIQAAFGPAVHTPQGAAIPAAQRVQPQPIPAGRGVAQRAVGFEFQCRYWEMVKPVEQAPSDKEDDLPFEFDRGEDAENSESEDEDVQWKNMPDKAKAIEGEDWILSPDKGDPEFIVSHEADDLAATMEDLMGVVATFQSKQKAPFPLTDLDEDADADAQIRPREGKKQSNVSADAQVNAGMRYSRIFDVLKDLGNKDSDAGQELGGNTRVGHYKDDTELLSQARARAAKLVESGPVRDALTGDTATKAEKSRKLMGFLALVGMYLAKAPELGEKRRLVKDFPLMVRTSMAIVAKRSVPRELLKGAGLGILVDAAVQAGDRGGSGEKIYDAKDEVEGDITINAWIRGLAAGEDKLTGVDMNLGALDDEDEEETVGKDEAPALVAEFRRVRQDMLWNEWPGFALGVEKWLEKVNQPKGTYTRYKRPS